MNVSRGSKNLVSSFIFVTLMTYFLATERETSRFRTHWSSLRRSNIIDFEINKVVPFGRDHKVFYIVTVPPQPYRTSFPSASGNVRIILVPSGTINVSAWVDWCRESENALLLTDDIVRTIPIHLPTLDFRNYAYLYAISQGAQFIWESELSIQTNYTELKALMRLSTSSKRVHAYECTAMFCNPYPYFIPFNIHSKENIRNLWPRGTPHDAIHNHRDFYADTPYVIKASEVLVFHTPLRLNPDIGSLSNIKQMRGINFKRKNSLISSKSGYLPILSHGTLWTHQSFWAMLLLSSTSRIDSDVLRSIVTQKVLRSFSKYSGVASAVAMKPQREDRIPFSLITKAYSSFKITNIAREVSQIKLSGMTTKKRTESIYSSLLNSKIISRKDFALNRVWWENLEKLNYAANLKLGIESTETENVPGIPETERRPKIAVCMSGPNTGWNTSVEDGRVSNIFRKQAKGTIRSSKIKRPFDRMEKYFFPKLFNPDVFISLYNNDNTNKNEEPVSMCDMFSKTQLGFVNCTISGGKRTRIMNEAMWEKYRLGYVNDERYIQRFMQELKGMLNCHDMIEIYSFSKKVQYDWIVRMSSDLYVMEFPDLDEVVRLLRRGTILHHSTSRSCCGRLDHFAIGSPEVMKPYLRQYLYIQQERWNYSNNWDGDEHFRKYLSYQGISLEESEKISVCPLLANTTEYPCPERRYQ